MGWADTLRGMASGAAAGALDVLAKASENVAAQQSTAVSATPKETQGNPTSDVQALEWDPFSVIDALGYKERPSNMTYATLQAMVFKMPVLQTVIKTRIDQVGAFAVPQEDKFQTGFRVQQRDHKASPSKASEKKSQEIQNWLLSTGTTDQPTGRDNFRTFLKKLTRDSLTYDAACAEIRYNNFGKPYDFYAVDAATIRLADTSKLHHLNKPDETRYVQVYQNLVNAEYTADKMIFGVRNPVTTIGNQGYGVAETEMLISTVTSLLWSWEYNQKQFSQGTSAKGIINFKGTVPDKMLSGFRRHWYSMVAGVENAFRTPILAMGEDLQYVDLQKSNTDMEFNAWFDFLIKIVCSIFGMDPMEINFKYGDTGSSNMFESSNSQKLGASKDKGLRPLLEFLADLMNLHLIHKIDEDFEIKFVGLDAQSPSDLADLNAKQVSNWKMVDELRAEEDLPPMPDGLGQVILNSVWIQNKAQEQAPEPEEGDENPFGDDEDEDGDFGGGDEDENDGNGDNEGKDSSANGKGDTPAKAGKPAEADEVNKSMHARRSDEIRVSFSL